MAARLHAAFGPFTVWAVCATALLGCGDNDAAPQPVVSEAERQLGASLLAPQDNATLNADEFAPDPLAAAMLAVDDLPPPL